jgi:hypothetical protein
MDRALGRAVTSQVDWWWKGVFRSRLEGLTDEEYWWKPVPDCWSLTRLGEGKVAYEHAWPPPTPAPFTTIAWRLCHIAVGCLESRTVRYFPESAAAIGVTEAQSMYGDAIDFGANAADALAHLDRWWDAWRDGLRRASDEDLLQPIGDREGDTAAMQLGVGNPVVNVVLHNHRELMHHGGEICLLRDLFQHQQPQDPFVVACLTSDLDELDPMLADNEIVRRVRDERPDLVLRTVERGHADVVARLLDVGFAIDAEGGVTSLHRAAASGDVALLTLLVERGASTDAVDWQWNLTPLGWAEYFGQQAAADYLRAIT